MFKAFSKGERMIFLWSLFGFIVIIPIVLNFLLPIQTGLVILGEPKDWLGFWSSYLAALGSFTLAMVSLWMNKRLHRQNEKNVNYVRWDKMVNRYNQVERFVLEEEQLHSEWFLKTMLYYVESHNDSEYKLYISEKLQLLLSCSLKTGQMLYEYGKAVKTVNCSFYEKLSSALYSCNISENEHYILTIKDLLMDNEKGLKDLMKLRLVYLQAEKKRVMKFARSKKLEVFL